MALSGGRSFGFAHVLLTLRRQGCASMCVVNLNDGKEFDLRKKESDFAVAMSQRRGGDCAGTQLHGWDAGHL